MTPQDNTGKIMSQMIRAADGTTVALTYLKPEARAMRNLVQSIRLKGTKTPSLSLIARRSMQLYVSRLESAKATRPDIFAAEVAELEKMVTRHPSPRPVSRKAGK